MKKQLNVATITNELRGNSAFFPRLKEEPAADPVPGQTPLPPVPPVALTTPSMPVANQVQDGTPERPNGRTPTRTPERPPERMTGRRIITRNSFELYEDQMESLRRLAYREKLDAGVGSMSRMVRNAIDRYLSINTSEED